MFPAPAAKPSPRCSTSWAPSGTDGRRGKPTWLFLQRIIAYFNVIWDDAEELQRLAELSDPRITIDTGGMSPEATELANRLSASIGKLSPDDLAALKSELTRRAGR